LSNTNQKVLLQQDFYNSFRGEPFVYPRLFELAGKHSDMAFMVYTNGTLIDEEAAGKIVEVGNLSPAISLEGRRECTDARRGAGTFDKVIGAMDLLKERGAIFGVSITVTRDNVMEVTSDDFIDFLVDKGVTYGWFFHYIPIGRDPDPELMVTPEQRAYLAERIPYIRTHKPIMLARLQCHLGETQERAQAQSTCRKCE
jgi:MoaA/NifB/PqqE/SkfB family radical SAM enzyme